MCVCDSTSIRNVVVLQMCVCDSTSIRNVVVYK